MITNPTTRLPAGCVAACPGCRHRGWTREASLEQKQQWLARALAPWGDTLQPVHSVEEPERWHYRDRAQLACQWDSKQCCWQFGLRRRDELIPISNCPVQTPRIAALLGLLSPLLPAPEDHFRLAYLVQSGAQTTLVLKQAEWPSLAWFSEACKTQLTNLGIEGVWLHRHPAAGKKVLAKNQWDLLAGVPRSRDQRGIWYGPAAFQQLVPRLFRQALSEAEQFLAPDSGSAVLDLYSGGGSSLQRWSQAGAVALGVEIGAEALACAALNAPEAELLRGSCLHRLPQMQAWTEAHRDKQPLLYANPPRTGIEDAVCEWIANQFRPPRIAYLSCSAGSLARDLARLGEAGYRVERISPYDFFPQTHHVETLALLSLG